MIQVTGKQLKEIAFRRRITSWVADACPTCDYPVKYVFQGEHPEVLHDPGCTCSDETFRARYLPSSWDQVADYINNLTDLELIKKTKEFWKL